MASSHARSPPGGARSAGHRPGGSRAYVDVPVMGGSYIQRMGEVARGRNGHTFSTASRRACCSKPGGADRGAESDCGRDH
eukprot:scaffold77220_cov70-Phaeocystis_antarctica.AAC.1